MHITLNVETDFEIKSLSDLPKFKLVMENLKMKINKSQLARELGVDRRTVEKYLNGFIPKRNIASQITLQVLTNLKTKSNIYCLNGSIEEVKDNPLLGINSDSFFINIRYLHQELR